MKSKPLKDISKKISSGLTPLRSNPAFWNSPDVPWVKTEQLGVKHVWDSNEKISSIALKETSIKVNPVNTLSIAMYGEGKTRGSVSILKSEATTNQACCNVIIDNEKADYEYVYYFLKTQYKQLRNLSSGVRKNLNSNDIKNFHIRLPAELASQRKIAQILAYIDEKIELNNKINAELEAMAKLIYDYWFVQFDFPNANANGNPYKSSGGKMVYNEKLKREIPEGWSDGKIENLIGEVPRATKIPSKEFKENGIIPVIDQSQTYICGFTDDETSRVKPKTAHIIFGDHTRVVKLVNFDYARGADGTQVLIANSEEVPSYLLYQLISDIDLSSYGYARHYKFLKDSKCVIPDATIAGQYQSTVADWFETIKLNITQNYELQRLRDWLLPMLMNGQVTVR